MIRILIHCGVLALFFGRTTVMGQRGPLVDSFIRKVPAACNTVLGSKLVVMPYHVPKWYVPWACSYEQWQLFSGYPNRKMITLFGQLLAFEGDTSLCGKEVCRYGYTDSKKPFTKTYTVQIDALYQLAILAVGGYAGYYCPYPVLVDTVTGKEVNDDPVAVREVFAVYRKWLLDNTKKKFKNFGVPLRTSRYRWYGIRESKMWLLSDTFRIGQLGGSFTKVGVCLD